jgi:carboxyl-terminal processing protease
MKAGAVIALLAVAGMQAFAADDPSEVIAPELKKMIDVFSALDAQGADPVSLDTAFYQGAIPGMLRTLDPHSSFFDPDQFLQLQQMERSEQKGFGSIVNVVPGRVIVLQVLPGTPSSKAGLSAGDEILAVNNIALGRLEPEQLIQVLSASRQQQATLMIHHPGDTQIDRIAMSPELMDTPTVDRMFLPQPGIGYLRITSFEEGTGKLVGKAIEGLGGDSLKGLVIDLRDNPGGAVQAAIDTASLFLDSGQTIFTARGRAAQNEEVRVAKYNKAYKFPIAVLVNRKTASAAEILTGALQDHDRAVVLGEPSYGKGLVQQVFNLSQHSGVALTTAFYYTPSGRSIQKPLNKGGQLDAATVVDKGPYKTDSGREVRGGGGIQPDQMVVDRADSRLRQVLDASSVLTLFAADYLKTHEVTEQFEITPSVLDELTVYLSERNIQPSTSEWLADRSWVQSRLKQEIFNLKFGVAKGDEIEMLRDPVVTRAIDSLGLVKASVQ